MKKVMRMPAGMADYLWMPHVLSMELRKLFAYRAAFWVRYGVGAVTDIAVAYFLWGAIFQQTGAERLEGFTFHGILFYYVFAALGSKVVRTGEEGIISREIYEGGLTRYLLYPLSFLQYRYVSFISHQLVAMAQLVLGLGVALLFWDLPPEQKITVGSVALGMATSLLSGALLFLIGACLELVAFWQDTVWNLIAMLRFIGSLLGGVLIPIAFFPDWGRELVGLTPFPLIFSFPIRCYLGQVSAEEWMVSAAQILGWMGVAILAVAWVWRRGTRRYSGVGI